MNFYLRLDTSLKWTTSIQEYHIEIRWELFLMLYRRFKNRILTITLTNKSNDIVLNLMNPSMLNTRETNMVRTAQVYYVNIMLQIR